ncbi:MAG: alpha-amylase family glycosyl hydrolase [Myxococcota bacterium]
MKTYAFCLLLVVGCDQGSGFNLPPLDARVDSAVVDGGVTDGGASDASGFCDRTDCGEGTCSEETESCLCDAGFRFDGVTCVADECGACDAGAVCIDGSCEALCTPDREVGEFRFCTTTRADSYGLVVRYEGSDRIDLGASEIRLNGASVDLAGSFDVETQTFTLRASSLPPSKYTYLFRVVTDSGSQPRPLFVPMWIGEGLRYADFRWNDSIVYQIVTDRFLNGDPSNDLDNRSGTLSQVDDRRSQWQGGDFAGITQKIRDGYFEDMGINTLWISSPIVNSHNAQPGVDPGDTRRFSSYHSYHPIATGYTHLDDYGYPNPIEPAFGTAEELHELVNEAHRRGIRIMPDFVANHVQREAAIFARHPEWFFEYNQCHNRWDEARIGCWFTSDMPDFHFGANPAAVDAVVDHALWMIQEFNFDAFRADALKHMDDAFVRALKVAVIEEIETTVDDHTQPIEPTTFYMVGESLGGWARYHVREDMVQGQVDEAYYQNVKGALLTFGQSLRSLADFAVANDRAYLRSEPTMGSAGGYPGAIMGNFFGNHDQWRALTEAGGIANPDAYRRLRLAQTFLMTSPYNVPMLYQGDDIGTEGGQDPDNRRMHRFDGLSVEEQASLDHMRAVGQIREAQVALRRGTRTHVVVEDWFWVFEVSHAGETVYVAINRDNDKTWAPPAGYVDALGNCRDGVVPVLTSCVFVAE